MGDKSDKNENDNLISLHCPMLTRSNYAAWAIKMRVFMQGQGVWEAIKSRTRNTAIDVKKDKLALASIYQGIPEDLLLSLVEKQMAKDAWETLKTTFMGAERVKTAKVQTLKAKFETLSMKDTEIIDDFAMKLNNIVSNIRALGEKVEDVYVVKKLLRAVLSKFLQIASTIEQFADLDNMTVEEVIGRLKSHEERVCGQSKSGEGRLLLIHQEWLEISKKKGDEEQRTSQRNTRSNVSNNRGRGRGRGRGNYSNRGGRRGGGSYQNRDGGRGSTSNYDKSKVQCYNCQDLGHYAYECKNPRKEGNHEANLTQKDDERALLLSVRHEVNEEVFLNEKHITPKLKNLNEESNTSKVWYLDNGACNHMTGDREKFSDINRSVQGNQKNPGIGKGCLEGKQTRYPYPTQTLYKAKERPELIHVDICGPISPPTPADEALGMFQKFHVLVENEIGLKHHFTAPYSLQQNGVVERRNRSVIEMARSMLKSMEVPDTLWGEAVRQAVYIQNRVPIKTLGDTTPYERWSGKKPNLEHLRVFGCIAHSKVLRGHQHKLDSRSEMLVHLGTETGSKAYCLLDPVSRRIRVSRDVRFDEGKLWKWGETTKFKEIPRSTFTIEGYSQEDTILEDENDPTDEPLESFEGINDKEFQPTPQTHIHGDEGLSTPTQSPVTYVGSTSPASSTTGGGAPKRYRLLTDIYEECDELLFMQDVELDAIEKNQTWSLVDLPIGRKPIGLKWVYKLKQDPSGNILKHKARLVAKGYVQKPGVDFDEVFAPVARIETIRILLAFVSSHGWRVHHLDVKSAFLNGWLEEEVYVTQPEGYVKANHPEKVYKLSKVLYGLRQAPRAWNSRLDKMWAGIWRSCYGDVKYFKEQMNKEFKISDMGLLSYYLGIEVTQHEDGITLKQSTYARNVLLKAGMADCNPSKSPMEHKEELTKDEGGVPVNATLFRSIIGGLRYLAHTRPDIVYAVRIVSRFMEKPTAKHMQAVKRILR
nr:hypothetical protein [Tanacetum cinerariifolium]